MRLLKSIGIFLVVAILIMVVVSTFMPNKQRVVRSIFINASPRKVYDQLSKLENFNKWTVWNLQDSSIKHVLTGTDGMVGSSTTWKGDPDLAGEGKIVITTLIPTTKIIHTIEISAPRKATAESEFDLEEVNGGTKLSWEFDLNTPRPWNIFNLFYTLDKRMGKDFDQGLQLMKTAIEADGKTSKKDYEVQPMNYPDGIYKSLNRYIANNHLTQKLPTIEQYITGPLNEKDTSRWQTKVIFLVE